jgi:trehalose-phosphatase
MMVNNYSMDSKDSALKKIRNADQLRLFLDYDGTLADFAQTPDEIYPDRQLIDLLNELVKQPSIQVAVISGRRLEHIRSLIPLQGILLAGTYGIEIQDPSGEQIDRVSFEQIRPTLDQIKPQWRDLIRASQDIYLEDKGWSLALHAKFLDQEQAVEILDQAREIIQQEDVPAELFRVLGGHKFLEVAPRLANKGITIHYLINNIPLNGELPVYIGDDDKDEEAFEVILEYSGVAIKVDSQPGGNTVAQMHLESPQAVRRFLASLVKTSTD